VASFTPWTLYIWHGAPGKFQIQEWMELWSPQAGERVPSIHTGSGDKEYTNLYTLHHNF